MRSIFFPVLLLSCCFARSEAAICPLAVEDGYLLPFSEQDINSIKLFELEHPFLGGVVKSESVPMNKFGVFVEVLKGAEYIGLTKVFTPYLIKIETEKNNVYEIKATESLFSARNNDCYYRFSGEFITWIQR